MSTHQNPTLLKQVLATTPLFHLIPKQNLSPLINLPLLVPIADDTALNEHIIRSIGAFDTEQARDFERECQQELLDYVDSELDAIKYKLFSTHAKEDAVAREYSDLDAQILDNEYIDSGKILSGTGNELVKTGRLSIRKKTPAGDETYVPKHNQKYFRKFEKEFMRLNPTLDEGSPSVSDDDLVPIVSIIPSKAGGHLKKLNFGRFNQFLRGGQKLFTWEDMVVICETLSNIDMFLDQDANDIVKILEICFVALSEAFNKLKDHKIVDFDDVKSVLSDILCATFASKALIIIIKYQIAKGVKMSFSKYTYLIAQTLEYVSEYFVLSLEKFTTEDADDLSKSLIHKLITETCNRLKQLASLTSMSSFEEQTLTKLEMLCINIAFSSKINAAQNLQSLIPVDVLQVSAGQCLVMLYKNSIDQRAFLLQEVLAGFAMMNSKKGAAKKFMTKRGFDIHLFTMIINQFACCFVESEGYSSDFMDYVSRELISKVQANPTELRPKLSFLIADLMQLLYLPEWPAADLFIISIATCLIQVLSLQDEQILAEVQFLDILQDLAVKFLGKPNDGTSVGEKEVMTILANCNEFDKGDALPFLKSKLQNLTGFALESEPTKSSETTNSAYKSLVLNHLVNFITTKYFNFLETQLSSSRAKARAKAIKGLLLFVSKSPQLLLSAQLQKQLSSRLQDPAALVREAMHEFLNEHISKNPEEAQKLIYLMYLAMDDSSITVRKRSIQSCMAVFPLVSEPVKLRIGEKILEKIYDEEDAVRNEAISTLKNRFLFQPPELYLTNPGAVDIIRIGKSKGTKLLMSFFKDYIFTDSHAVNFVDSLVLSSMQLVSNAEDVEGGMLLLSMLAQLNPNLVTQDTLVELKSFYLDEANVNTAAYSYALGILETTTTRLKGIRPEFSIEIQSFLLSKIINFHQKDMLTATAALWNLSRLSSTEGKIANAVVGTLKWVRKLCNEKNYKQLPKLVQLLGCFGKLLDLQLFQNVFIKEGFMSERDSVMSILFKHILAFTKPEYPATLRKYALSNLVLACSSQPRMITHPTVMARLLEAIKTEPANVKCAIIQNINIYLDDYGTVDAAPLDNFRSIQEVSNVQQNACKVLVDTYFDEIIKQCTSTDIQLVLESFLFVRMSLEMGLANPIKGIAMVVALQGSPTLTLQKAAYDLYKYLFDKYKPIVESQFADGIRLAYAAGQIARNMFVLLYNVAGESRTSRNKFIKSVSKFFVVKPKSNYLAEDLKFVLFVIERVSLIKYKTIEEVYIILDQLQQVLQNYAPDYIHDLRGTQVGDENSSDMAYLIYLILDFYNYLSAKYNISSENIEGFSSRCLEIDFLQAPTIVSTPILHVDWIFTNMCNLDSLKFVVKEIRRSIFVHGGE